MFNAGEKIICQYNGLLINKLWNIFILVNSLSDVCSWFSTDQPNTWISLDFYRILALPLSRSVFHTIQEGSGI